MVKRKAFYIWEMGSIIIAEDQVILLIDILYPASGIGIGIWSRKNIKIK